MKGLGFHGRYNHNHEYETWLWKTSSIIIGFGLVVIGIGAFAVHHADVGCAFWLGGAILLVSNLAKK